MRQAPSVDELLDGILEAIRRARVADRRLRLAASLGDEEGVQIAYQAILHNLTVIAEAVRTLPAEVLARDPATPWGEIAAMGGALGHDYHRIVPATVHGMVESQLDPLEPAVRRLRAAR